jgi:hypothetical protein
MFSASGGHWMLLQSVAWGGMMLEYARADGLAAAVETVFDGRHPCGLCKEIHNQRSSEQKPDAPLNAHKLELFFSQTPLFVVPEPRAWVQVAHDTAASIRAIEPLLPPPRAAHS